MAITEGARAPSLTLHTTTGDVRVPDPAGRPVLLMFFQEAGTPTCTTQVSSLAAERALLDETGALAVCISTDPMDRLEAFARAIGDAAPALATDPDGAVARTFGVYDETGRRAQRAAFVIGGDGTVKLAVPWYNPANSEQFASLFAALGVDA
jgi:peroxiredoxin